MVKPTHNRSITKADKKAADRLKAIWLAIPRPERPTQQQLADMWDLPSDANQSLMSQYVNGQIALNYPALLFFAKALNCEPTDIRDDLPEQKAIGAPAVDEDSHPVPGFAHDLALGDGSSSPEEYAETHRLLFRKSSLRKKGLFGRRLEVYYGRGDSMEPRIRDGDALLIDRDDLTPRDGEIFVLENDNNDAVCKRLTNIDGRWFYESDNKAEPKHRKPVPLDGKTTWTIAGRVRWIGSWEG